MPHEIIMPALGMAQKTGHIVAWRKAPGDAVKAMDILLDVETDKTTMEVEAGHDGFVAALMAAAGDDVPVGSTIAIISGERPDPTAALAKAPPAVPVPLAAPTPMPAAEERAVARYAPAAQRVVEKRPLPKAAGGGRILASPKTRRLAAERGIDLGRLVALGMKQPFHAADLDALPLQAAPSAVAPSEIAARVSAVGLAGMLRLLREEADGTGSPALFAAFAASSLRAAGGDRGEVAVRVEQGGEVLHYRDPDRMPLSRLQPSPDDTDADIVVRDFTGTCLVSARLSGERAPVLMLAGDAGNTNLRLVFDSSRLAPAAAAAFVTGFAARLVDPLRQLL